MNINENYNNLNEKIKQSNCAGTVISNRQNHVIENKNICNTTKDLENNENNNKNIKYVPMSQGDYLLKLDNKCVVNNDYKFTRNTVGGVLPGSI